MRAVGMSGLMHVHPERRPAFGVLPPPPPQPPPPLPPLPNAVQRSQRSWLPPPLSRLGRPPRYQSGRPVPRETFRSWSAQSGRLREMPESPWPLPSTQSKSPWRRMPTP